MAHATQLIGRLAYDARLQYTQKGKPYCRLRVLINRVGTDEDNLQGYDVVVWGQKAAALATARKGDVVQVRGRLETQQYERDGEQREHTRVVASWVHVFPAPRHTTKGGGQ